MHVLLHLDTQTPCDYGGGSLVCLFEIKAYQEKMSKKKNLFVVGAAEVTFASLAVTMFVQQQALDVEEQVEEHRGEQAWSDESQSDR